MIKILIQKKCISLQKIIQLSSLMNMRKTEPHDNSNRSRYHQRAQLQTKNKMIMNNIYDCGKNEVNFGKFH